MEYKFKKIKDIIKSYKKDDIISACDILNLDYKKSWKKEVLMAALEEGLVKYPTELYYVLSHDELLVLEKMFKNMGSFIVKDTKIEVGSSYREIEAFNTLCDLCLIDSAVETIDEEGAMVGYVSEEFANVFSPFIDENRMSHATYLDETAALIKGCLYYYGAMHIDELYDVVQKKLGGLDKKLFTRVLSYKYSLSDAFLPMYIGEEEYIVDRDFPVYFEIKEIYRWGKGMGYRNYSKEDLMAAADPLFIENMKLFSPLYDYFKKFFIQDQESLDLFPEMPKDFFYDIYMADTVDILRITPLSSEIIQDFLSNMEFRNNDELEKGLNLLTSYYNNISRWENRGYTPSEVKGRKLEKSNVIPMKAYLGKKKN